MSSFPPGNDAGWGPWLLCDVAVWIWGGAGVAGRSGSPGAARPGARGSAAPLRPGLRVPPVSSGHSSLLIL